MKGKSKKCRARTKDLSSPKTALKEKEEQLRVVLDKIKEGITFSDENGRFYIYNAGMEKITGYTMSEANGSLDFARLIYPIRKDYDTAMSGVAELLKSGRSREVEVTITAKGGKARYVLVDSSLVKFNDKKMFLSTYHDITKQKNYEIELQNIYKELEERVEKRTELLKTSEEKFRTVVENIGTGISLISPEMEILTLNKKMREWFPDVNVKNRPICYKSFNNPPGENICAYCPVIKTFNDGETHLAITSTPRNDIFVRYKIISSPIKDSSGKVVAVIEMVDDVTEREMIFDDLARAHAELEKRVNERTGELLRANEHIQKLSDIKSDFVATVSHELRTPLAIIKTAVCLLIDEIVGKMKKKQTDILITAKDNIDRLTRLIDSLLDVSKIESGNIGLKKDKFDLIEAIKKSSESFEPKLAAKGLELKMNLQINKIEVYADPDRILQVFNNLIDNAVKFTEKGVIEISASLKNNFIECSVSDTGRGISSDNLPKIFNKFEQFGRPVGPGEKGIGLGLSIVKAIIELHDGQIWAESELGTGSKFTFRIPL